MSEQNTTSPVLVSPYGASKILNAVLSEHGLPSTPPQMMYNYVRNNLILSTTINGKVLIDTTSTESPKNFVNWMVRYLTKKGVVLTTTTATE